jgi:hypothetical protein
MRKWFTAIVLVAAMVGSVVGVGAHEREGSCPMSNMPDCCKKAQSANSTPEVSMARLCCNLNCSEPGSSGSNTSASFSSQPGSVPVAVLPKLASFRDVKLLSSVTGSPHAKDSNPKYLQHLALLI